MKSLRSRTAYRPAAMTLSVLLALGITSFTAPTAWGSDGPGRDLERVASGSHTGQAAPLINASVSAPIKRANAALTRAEAELQAHHPLRAIAALSDLKRYIGRAHTAAMNLIGAPPSDPESDEPPGPPAVLAVLGLEHRVGMRVVPLFDDRRRTNVIDSLRSVLRSAHHHRNVMLDAVIALPPEGAGADYSDGMADTLGQYTKEIQLISTALHTYHLTTGARTALHNALDRVRATKAKVNAAFGGGE